MADPVDKLRTNLEPFCGSVRVLPLAEAREVGERWKATFVEPGRDLRALRGENWRALSGRWARGDAGARRLESALGHGRDVIAFVGRGATAAIACKALRLDRVQMMGIAPGQLDIYLFDPVDGWTAVFPSARGGPYFVEGRRDAVDLRSSRGAANLWGLLALPAGTGPLAALRALDDGGAAPEIWPPAVLIALAIGLLLVRLPWALLHRVGAAWAPWVVAAIALAWVPLSMAAGFVIASRALRLILPV